MKKKRLVGITYLSVFGLIIGTFCLLNTFLFYDKMSVYLVFAFICFAISIGLFKLWNWARVLVFVFSFSIIAINLLLIYGEYLHISGQRQTWAGMGIILLSPVTIFCLFSLLYLNRPKVKEQFKGEGQVVDKM